jgi:hypothetical protein
LRESHRAYEAPFDRSGMIGSNERRAFILFHAVLGLGLLIMGLQALAHALHELDGRHGHLALVGGLEAIGAVLFLIPATLRWGGAALLVVLLGGFIMHLTRGEWVLEHLTFAAGVWFVMVHGAAWGTSSGSEGS